MENDYELIYLIKDRHSEYALNHMIKKYIPLIYKIFKNYNINNDMIDDFIQEGLEVIYHAIFSFDDTIGCPFYSYVKLLLERRIIRVLNENKMKNVLRLNEIDIIDSNSDIYEIYTNKKTYYENLKAITKPQNKEIYYRNTMLYESPKVIADDMGMTSKEVSNVLYRCKKQIKDFN